MSRKAQVHGATPTVPLETLFSGFTPETLKPLEILADNAIYAVIVGRTKELHEEVGLNGTLFVGMVCEKNSGHFGKKLLIDAVNPHKIFISGKTGSGKSYTLGVIAEELAEQNLGIGTIIVDPMGTFWSMKHSKPSKKDDLRAKWGLQAKSFENIRVFVPVDLVERYNPGTFDDVFSISPEELTAEDWTNTFGLDYFRSPQSALIIELIKTLTDGGNPDGKYTLRSMINVLEENPLFEEKYQANTIRALMTRLESALNWGVFSTTGTPISRISVPNQVSVIDVSLLPDNTRALVIGMLAKKILELRTKIARQEKINEMTGVWGSGSEETIPVTWMMVDEAHTLVPSKGRTAASSSLIEFAKRGRMPGCALVLATQQPSSTSDEILSQIDILISHNLSYSQDILELKKRTPSRLTQEIGDEAFIRNLPVGAAVVADQTTSTKRAFVAMIRPRISEHGGKASSPIKEAHTTKLPLSDKEVRVMAYTQPTEVKEAQKTGYLKPSEPVAVPHPLPEIKIPQHDIPEELLVDYLERFMKFKVVSEIGIPVMGYVSTKLFPNKNVVQVTRYMDEIRNRGYKYEDSHVLDDNPVLVFTKNSSHALMTFGHTNSSTVIVLLSQERMDT